MKDSSFRVGEPPFGKMEDKRKKVEQTLQRKTRGRRFAVHILWKSWWGAVIKGSRRGVEQEKSLKIPFQRPFSRLEIYGFQAFVLESDFISPTQPGDHQKSHFFALFWPWRIQIPCTNCILTSPLPKIRLRRYIWGGFAPQPPPNPPKPAIWAIYGRMAGSDAWKMFPWTF